MNMYLYIWLSIFEIYSCSVLLWSNKKIYNNPLQKFTDDDFNILLEAMEFPDVIAYNIPNPNIPQRFKELIDDDFSAYNANNELDVVNSTDLLDDENKNFLTLKEAVDRSRSTGKDYLFVIISNNYLRIKRDLEDMMDINDSEPQGPVVYIGKSKTNDRYGIIYSSSPLLLKMNNTDLYLGETSADMVSVDTVARESITRLNVNIPQSDGRKIMLRFIFTWLDSYWYLTSVRMSDTSQSIATNLTIDKEVSAPAGFSYHCFGSTAFTDSTNDIFLYLTDMQVQIDSRKESFGDAYDCISFTTIPIWSGIFVSTLLIGAFFLALISLWDIKTMDKFDNHKTKQLTITVIE